MNRRIALMTVLALCLVLVSSLAAAGGPKALSAPTIDTLQGAANVQANQSYTVPDAHLASYYEGEPAPSCVVGGQGSVWFKFRADRAITVRADTSGSYFAYDSSLSNYRYDTVMTLFKYPYPGDETPQYGNLAQAACNDDVGGGVRHSQIEFTAEPDMWYYIRVTPYKANPIPAGSTFRLNLQASNLLDETSWKFSGAGKADDAINCDAGCYFNFNHSALGGSKLTQKIESFKGVKLAAGSHLTLSADAYLSGADHNFKAKLTIVYKDGTTVNKQLALKSIQRTSEFVSLETLPLQITKPVAALKVRFTDKVKTDGLVSLSNVALTLSPKPLAAVPAALPLPQAPK